MSTLYAFCIGGTGALCLESLVHLCATGQGPKKLVPVMMDPDSNNANVLRTMSVINSYRDIRARLDPGYNSGFFSTEIEVAENTLVWSPVTRARAQTLSEAVRLTAMEGPLRDLTQMLFSQAQLDQQLDQGFRGNPAIGSVLMQAIETEPFFANITSKIKNEPASSVFLFGSVFGGTGASGFPVIAHLIRAAAPQARIGGALVLPYFSIGQPSSEEAAADALHPESAQFLVNAAGALPFYARETMAFSSLYYLGDELSMHRERGYSAGGPSQNNASHVIELLAALAARHFAAPGGMEHPAYYLSVHDRDLGWRDLPGLDAERLNAFTSFGIFFHDYFAKLLETNLNELEKDAFMQSWVASLELPKSFFRDHKDDIVRINTYLQRYFRWLTELHSSTVALDLYHTDFGIDRYQRHFAPPRRKIMGVTTKEPASMKSISEVHSYCNATPQASPGAGPLTRFVNHLTLGMDRFNQEWYHIPPIARGNGR